MASNVDIVSSLDFLAGGGEMGERIRQHEWAVTSLGRPETWPQALRTAVRLILNTGHPMYIFWGPDGHCFYNDAYRQSIGPERHPGSLGRPARAVWEEIWPIIGPQIDQVLSGGGATWQENHLVPITRNGKLDEVYWTYSYGPIDDETASKGVGGVLVVCTETTAQVLAERRLSAERERQRLMLQQMPGFVALLSGPDHRYDYVNDAYQELAGDREFLGHSVREVFPDIAGQGFYELLDRVYTTGEPYVVSSTPVHLDRPNGARFVDLLYAPVRNDDGTVTGIFVGGFDVTDHHHALDRLRRNEAELQVALNAARLGTWTLDLVTGDLSTSATCRSNFGRLPDAPFSYSELREAVHPDDSARMAAAVDRSVATGEVYDIDYRIVTPAGETRWVQIRAQPTMGPDGTAVGMTGVSLDITERRNAAAELRETEERLRLAVDNAEVGFWDVDPVNDRLVWPARTKALFGISPDVPVSMADFYNGLHPDDREATSEAYAGAADPTRRELYDVEYRTIGKEDGVIRWVAAKGRGVFDDAGKCIRVVGTAIDITDRKAIEAALAESDARYRTLFENIDSGFCVIEMIFDDRENPIDYRFLETNSAFAQQTGLQNAVGKRMRALFPEHEQHWFDMYGRVATTGEPARFEDEAAALDRWFEVYAYRVESAEDRTVAVLFNDVTERKRADERLRTLNETLEAQVGERTAALRQYHDIVEATTSPICAFDTDYRLIAFNKAHNDEFRRVNGFDTKLGDVFPDLFIPEQRPVMRALMGRALAGERFTVTEEFGRPELGQPLWEISYTPLRDESGVVIGAFHLANDISDRLRAEADLAAAQEALRQSQKMEAMGSLTGGVAHDFNNLLTPIVGSLDLLQRKGVGGAREQRMIDGALQAAERAKTLVQRLLAFARRQPLQAEAIDIAGIVEGMSDLIASTSGPRVRVELDIDPDLQPALADANQVEMALLNLAVNARDAMPDGGRLTLSAAAEMVAGEHRAGLAPGRYVRLSVADTGAGMDEATLARATEPFFSTKGVGKGTGLGLSMVHGLAAQLGGSIVIASKPALGTTVELWLPASEEPVRAPDQQLIEREAARTGTVLLIDDEDLVRASTSDMLVELGYEVVEAASAEAALQLIDDGMSADLVITDHLMPEMTGTDFVRLLHHKNFGAATLIISGYAEVEGIAPELPRLVKPFKQADLAAAIAQLMVSD